MYIPESGPAKPYRGGNAPQTVLHEHDIRGIYRDITARSDRYADIGSGERRRVIDSVSDHRDLALCREALYHICLASGQNSRDHAVHSGAASYGVRCSFVIAGQHNNFNTLLFQLRDRFGRIGFQLIGHADDTEQRNPSGLLLCEE